MSDGVWPDVMSGVRVHVRELEEKAILSSASLRLTGRIDSPNGITTVNFESLGEQSSTVQQVHGV